ncbi:hypothetical protein ACFV5N_00785 [Streptomyces sp. NPDC059853]|uniref:hypothetical protein n=1 Tax=Streptomyces sp. NPDC059853 TaxID=3346973 RepID=UPI00364ECF06
MTTHQQPPGDWLDELYDGPGATPLEYAARPALPPGPTTSSGPVEGRLIPPAPTEPPRAPHPGPVAPPGTADLPPWRVPDTPPAPAPPPPPPQQVVAPVVLPENLTIELRWEDPPPPPTNWQRFKTWVKTRTHPVSTLAGIGLAFVPIPEVGYGAAAIWGSLLLRIRGAAGADWGYAAAIAAIVVASAWAWCMRDVEIVRMEWPRVLLTRFVVATVAVGALSVIHPWDPIQVLTGVAQ